MQKITKQEFVNILKKLNTSKTLALMLEKDASKLSENMLVTAANMIVRDLWVNFHVGDNNEKDTLRRYLKHYDERGSLDLSDGAE